MPTNIVIPYTPRVWAEGFHETKKRWIVLVFHRRAGKSTAVVNHLQRDALRTRDSRFGYIFPTYKQAKFVAWDMVKFYARTIPNIKFNEADLTVLYPNGSKLTLYGADNPDSLRGIALWGVGFDEFSQQPSNIFTEVVSKCLADHYGYAIWFGTPKGKNEFFRLYERGRSNPDWYVKLQTIDETLATESGETIENLRKALEDDKKFVADGLMTLDEFNQEWYCSFEAAIKGAYYAGEIANARKNGRIKHVPYEPALKVHTVWDLGVGQAMGIGFYQRTLNETRMIDYWEGSTKEGIPQAIKALQNKPYVYGLHFAPHDINATDIGTGKTRLETAKGLGIKFTVIPSLPVDDGINAGKLMWSHLWVDEANCQVWLDYIAQYRQEWDEKRGMFKENPRHDFTSHAGDVHRYASLVEKQMTNDSQKPVYKQKEWEVISEYEGGS